MEASLGDLAGAVKDQGLVSYVPATGVAQCRVNLEVEGVLRIGPGQTLAMANDRMLTVAGGSFFACGETGRPATVTALLPVATNGFSFVAKQGSPAVVFRHAVLSYCGKKTKDYAPEKTGLYCRADELIVEHSLIQSNCWALTADQSLVMRDSLIAANVIGVFAKGGYHRANTTLIERCQFTLNQNADVFFGCRGGKIIKSVFKDSYHAMSLHSQGDNEFIDDEFLALVYPGGDRISGNRFLRCRFTACDIQGRGHVFEDCVFDGLSAAAREVIFLDSPVARLERSKTDYDSGNQLPGPISFIRCKFNGLVMVSQNTPVTIQWPLTVQVRDTGGKPLAGAYLAVMDCNGIPDPQGPYLTNQEGRCVDIPCIQVRNPEKGKYETLTPHGLKAWSGNRTVSTNVTISSKTQADLILK